VQELDEMEIGEIGVFLVGAGTIESILVAIREPVLNATVSPNKVSARTMMKAPGQRPSFCTSSFRT